MHSLYRLSRVGTVVLVAAVLVGGGALTRMLSSRSTEFPTLVAPSIDAGPMAAAIGTPETVRVIATWPFDFSDERVLMGVSSHAFLGLVIEQVGTAGIPIDNVDEEIPQTQFAVKVLEVVKGDLPDQVTVNQSGGINEKTGQLELIEGDSVLKPGEIIFFVTWHDPETEFYDITGASRGAIRVDNAADQATVIARFEEAVLNEVDADALLQAAAESADADVQVRVERDRNDHDRDARDRDDRKRERRDRTNRDR